jgi:hypothetical protein
MTSDDPNTSDDWSNFETETVHHWMIEDPDVAREWRKSAAAVLADKELFPDRQQACEALAREIREATEDECCLHTACLGGDLLDAALSRVNWLEIAESLLSACERGTNPKHPQPEN